MSQLIVQADDIALSHGTTLGIIDSIRNGMVRSTGLFANCPDAPFAAEQLKGLPGVDVGIDLNFVTGAPVLPPEQVPGLVREDGTFRSSVDIKARHRVVSRDGYYLEFAPEPFDYEQTLAEARAQLRRFEELMGRPPAYVHHHSLISPVSDAALMDVARESGLLAVDALWRGGRVPLLPNDWYVQPFGLEEQAVADPLAAFRKLVPRILEHEISVLVTHPGYVDAEALELSTYSVIRARDLQLMTSPEVLALLEENGIELVNYSTARVGGEALLAAVG